MAWLSGWDKRRIEFTVDHTKIDSTLSWFRVVVKLTPAHTAVFTELTNDANRFKIAFTKANGTTELYGEIEYWDDASETAVIHVSRDGWELSDTVDTLFYMYFDVDHANNTTYIGDIDSTPGAAVWDSHAKAVYHQVDATTSTVKDSTSNNNDGTKKGANEPIEAVGKVHKGQDFDGGDDYIQCGTNNSLDVTTILTISVCINSDDARLAMVVGKINGTAYRNFNYAFRLNADNKGTLLVGDQTDWDVATSTNALIAQDGWYHIAVTWDGTTVRFYVNGSESSNHPLSFTASASTGEFNVGRESASGAGAGQWFMDGDIDEVHFSNSIVRTAAWVKAEYNALWNTLISGFKLELGLELSESFSISDSLVKIGEKALIESFSIIDNISKWGIIINEAFSVADSLFKSGVKQLSEAFSVADSWVARFNLSEAFSIADSLVKNGTEQLSEAFSIADSLVKNGIKSLAESFSIIDSWRMVKRFTETVKVVDSIIKKHVITMMIRKIIIRVRGGSYESDIELED